MKPLLFLFLSIFVSSTFASNYQQVAPQQANAIMVVYTQVDATNTHITQVKTLVTYNPQLNLVQQLMVSTTAHLSSTPSKKVTQAENVVLDVPSKIVLNSEQSYLRSLERDQFYPINELTNINLAATKSQQTNSLNQQSWKQDVLQPSQTVNQNNLLLGQNSWQKKQQQIMF
jgi:hypothetical protein